MLGIHIECRWSVYQTIQYFAHAWLTWDDSRGSKNKLSWIHGGNLHQVHMNSRKSLLPSKHKLHERNTKALLTKFSTLGWCSTWFMGGDKMLLMGSTATHRNFHITGLPPSCEHGDSIGQTKRCSDVCSRDQPRVRQHYEHRWFWFDLTIAHT